MCSGKTQPINNPGTGGLLFRALNLRGLIPGDLAQVVSPEVTVMDLSQPEFAWLARTKRYFHGLATGAVVGQNSQAEIRCLNTLGLITVVDQVELQATAATGVGLFMSTIANLALTTSTRHCAMDARQEEASILSGPTPGSQVVSGSSVFAIPGNAAFFSLGVAQVIRIPGPFVLRPGTQLRIVAGTTNVNLDVRLWFSERSPMPSEL